LRTHGYTVLAAGGPLDALSVAGEHAGPIHALVTDVIMPAMSGRELATRLIGPRPEMRAVYMSGYPGQVIATHGVLDGDTVFVQKPFTVEALTGAVREALDGAPGAARPA
jgi:DNA-binding NtrC family response regulator